MLRLREFRHHARSMILVGLTIISTLFITGPLTGPVWASAGVTSNRSDTTNQHWIGVRPLAQSPDTVNYRQKITSAGGDSNTRAMLAAEVYALHMEQDPTNHKDQVDLRFVLDANSRQGVNYGVTGPNSLPTSYAIQTTTDTGINCTPCGTWVTLPTAMVYYGAQGAEGTYSQIWVSSDGYLSVVGPTSSGSLGPGVIAAFDRPLNPGKGGHIWTWSGSNNGYQFFVAWDNVPSVSGGNPESFFIWIHDSGFTIDSPYNEAGIEFWYSSISPNDGVPTAVGIADQYGNRQVSVNPSTISNNQKLVFHATSGAKYLNSFKIDLSSQSNGQTDQYSQIQFVNPQSPNPVGYNVLFRSPITSSLLPDWYGSAMAVAGIVSTGLPPPLDVTGGLIIGTIDLGANTFDQLYRAWYNSNADYMTSQSGPGSTSPAEAYIKTREQGVQTLGAPTDASFAAEMQWIFSDPSKTSPHSMTITATVGYCDCSFGGADTWTVTTSLQIDIVPDHKVSSTNFEAQTGPLPNTWSSNSWTVTNQCPSSCFEGSNAAYSHYTTSSVSDMIEQLPHYVGYSQLYAYLHLWIETGASDSFTIDYLSSGSWTNAFSYSGSVSSSPPRSVTALTQWISPTLVLPTTTTALRFRLTAGCCSTARGAYLDDFFLFGDGPSNYHDVPINGILKDTSAVLSAPISINSGSAYNTPIMFLSNSGLNTFTAQNFFGQPGNLFTSWADDQGHSTNSGSWTLDIEGQTTLTVSYELWDFSATANPNTVNIVQGNSAPSTLTLTSVGSFVGSIGLSGSIGGGPAGTCPGPNCPTVTISQTPIPVSPSSPGTSSFTIVTGSSTPTGTYTLAISASTSAPSHTYSIPLNVQDFSISALPTIVNVGQGQSGSTTISVVSQGAGTVTLTPGISGGPSGTCPGQNCPTIQLSSTTVSSTSGTWSTSIMTINALSATPLGNYNAVVTGRSGSLAHSTTVTFSVLSPDFSISANPPSPIPVGGSQTESVSLTSLYGFSGSVSVVMSVPSGLCCSSQTSTSLVNGQTTQLTFTVSASSTTQPNLYTITFTGTSGSLQHQSTLSAWVVPMTVDFAPSSYSPYIGAPDIFTASVQNGVAPFTYSWNFEDGSNFQTATGNPASHCFSVLGTFVVSLSVTDSTGATKTVTHAITVNVVALYASFSYSPTPIYPSHTETITPTIYGGEPPYNVYWNFGDGSTTTSGWSQVSGVPAQTHVYAATGSYSVNLTVVDRDSVKMSSIQTISVIPYPSFSMTVELTPLDETTNAVPGEDIYLYSLNSFNGNVALSVSITPCLSGSTCNGGTAPSTVWNDTRTPQTSATIPTGATPSCGASRYPPCVYRLLIIYTHDGTGEFTVTISGTCTSGTCTSPAQTFSATIDLWVCNCHGGGSVAAGTLITLADGTQVPVQQLQTGMKLLSYDMATHQYVITTITKFVTVVTHNQMEISTSTGKPLIVDQNPAQKLYVKTPDGAITLMSVTDLKVGYALFDAISQTWAPITTIHYQNGGTHLMYDIYTTSPGNYIANGYLDPLKT